MGRRRKRDLDDDDFDSSDDGENSDADQEGFGDNPDEVEEFRLFRNPYQNNKKKRKTRAQIEEQKMMGIFAEDDSDEGVDRRRGRTMAPVSNVSFVKSDKKVGGQPEDDEQDEEGGEDDDEGNGARGGLGSMGSRGGLGLGFGAFRRDFGDASEGGTSEGGAESGAADSAMDEDAEEDNEGEQDNEGSETATGDGMDVDEPEEEDERPRLGLGGGGGRGAGLGFQQRSGLGNGARAGIGAPQRTERKTISSSKKTADPTTAPKPAKKSKNVDKTFGKFEKHTKGFASKMMEKMGWTPGQGLGKEGVGIVQPIDVQVRPRNQGLAYNNFKEQTKAVREIEKEVKERNGIKWDVESSGEEDEGGKGRRKKGKGEPKGEKVQSWKAGQQPGKRKVTYKSAQELLAEQLGNLDGGESPVSDAGGRATGPAKIIDMTSAGGPREVDLANLKSVSQAMTDSMMDDARSLPELRHNMRLIVDLCQHDLLLLQKKKRAEDAKGEKLRREKLAVQQQLQVAERTKTKMARVGALLAVFESHAALLAGEQDALVALNSYENLFARIERDLSEELPEYRLDELCVAAVTPWCQKLYAVEWHPLEDPERGVVFFRRWRRSFMVDPALGQAGTSKRELGAIRQMTPYESLLSLVWLSRIRQVISNEWDPRSPDDLIALLETWYGSSSDNVPLLPQWLFLNILDQLITPKLERALGQWNPKKDAQQVHTWIHPWLPLFGDKRMQPLLDTVRQKMSVVLQDWNPSEDTAIKMLEPWKEVFSAADMEQLVTRIILPKLLLALRHELIVNPARQDIKPIKWVLQWRDLLGPNLVAHALQSEFFPKWLWTLWQWLSHPTCNPAEVTQWYGVWKSPSASSTAPSGSGVFPVDVLRHPAVAAGFRQGLDLMNQAMELRDSGIDLAKIPSPVPPPSTSGSAPPPLPKFAASDRGWRSASPILLPDDRPRPVIKPAALARYHASIHDVMEEYFAARELTFLPVEGRVHEGTGKPLWKVSRSDGQKAGGSLLAYLEDGVLYAKQGARWEPMSMEDAADRVVTM